MKDLLSMNVEKRKEWIYLSLILTVGFLLRIYAVNFGLPFLYHADEPIIVNHALAYGSGDFNPHFFNIPPLISYLLFGCYGVYYVLGYLSGAFSSTQDFFELFILNPSSFYLIARFIFGVVAGSFSLYFLYRFVKTNDSAETAFVTLILFAFNFLHVQDSHYVYADIPLILVLIFSLSILIKAIQKPAGFKGMFYFGCLAGLATAIKYNGIFIYTACLPAMLLRDGKTGLRFKGLAIAFVMTVFVFIILNPYSLIDMGFFLKEIKEQSATNTGAGWFHHFIYSLPQAMGWPVLILALLGIILTFSPGKKNVDRIENRALQITACFILSYYIVLIFKAQSYGRYVLPLVPFLCYMAAHALSRIKTILKFGNKSLFITTLILSAMPAYKIAAWDLLMSREDTRTQAASWIKENIKPGSRLALDWDFYMPRLPFTDAQLDEKMQEVRDNKRSEAQLKRIEILKKTNKQEGPSYHLSFLVKNPDEPRFLFARPAIGTDYAEIKANHIQYVAIAETYRENDFQLFVNELEKQADKVVTFSPYKTRTQKQIDKQPMTGGPFLFEEVKKRTRNGPIINIYKVRQQQTTTA